MSDENQAPPAAQAVPVSAPVVPPALKPTMLAQPAPAQPTIPAAWVEQLTTMQRATSDEQAKSKALEAERETLKEQVAKMQETIGLTERQSKELAAARRADAIRHAAETAAVKHGAISESQVVKLILEDLDEVDGKIVSKADPKLSAEDHVAGFLKANPHLQKPVVAQGSGASPFPKAAPTAQPQKFDMTTTEGLTAYARSRTYPVGQSPAPVAKQGT